MIRIEATGMQWHYSPKGKVFHNTVRAAVDDDFEIYLNCQSDTCLNKPRSSASCS